jgi:hypothetical protein
MAPPTGCSRGGRISRLTVIASGMRAPPVNPWRTRLTIIMFRFPASDRHHVGFRVYRTPEIAFRPGRLGGGHFSHMGLNAPGLEQVTVDGGSRFGLGLYVGDLVDHGSFLSVLRYPKHSTIQKLLNCYDNMMVLRLSYKPGRYSGTRMLCGRRGSTQFFQGG